MSDHNKIQYFLGSNTKRGFVPLFNQLRDPNNGNRLFILKGGPGSGKSSLMKRLAQELENQGHHIEYIPCASDPKSLDAFLDYDTNTSIVDGTAPHTMDPNYPGAYETIINMGDFWDQNTLKENKNKIIELSDVIGQYHTMATSCITAGAALLDSNQSIAGKYMNPTVVNNFLLRFIKELENSPTGTERKRLLSAVSVGDTVFFDTTITSLCPKLYGISDEWGAVSDYLLSSLHRYAISKKLDMITCYCSIKTPDKIDHLLFPSAGIAITTLNSFHSVTKDDLISVEGLMKPIDKITLDSMNRHLSIAKDLILTAGKHVRCAKELHDDLEAYYISTMDFSKVDSVYDQLIHEFLAK